MQTHCRQLKPEKEITYEKEGSPVVFDCNQDSLYELMVSNIVSWPKSLFVFPYDGSSSV